LRRIDPPLRVGALREPARADRRRTEALAGRLVSGPASLAFAAGTVVDECDAPALLRFRDHLVSQHRACELGPELLDVGPAEAAGEHAHLLSWPIRLREVDQARRSGGVESDGAPGST